MDLRSGASEATETFRASVASDARVVVSPYRICPIGAHSDHQGGPVLGMTVNAHTRLAFTPSEGPTVELTSENFPGAVRLEVGRSAPRDLPDWGRYAEAALRAVSPLLTERPRGLVGRVRGSLPGGGLASSASVLLAYIEALAAVNELALDDRQKIDLALEAERDHVGVKVGTLDPGTIVAGKRDRLIALDTETSRYRALALGADAPAYRILIVFSGQQRQLTASPYNDRVEQCSEAVRYLAAKLCKPEASGLNAFTDEQFKHYASDMPEVPRRRARHFFTERSRVRQGTKAWEEGELARFGELMNASCRSSIENWESGSPELIAIQSILERTEGLFGSRFSGAGFGGCVLALVHGEDAEAVRERVERRLDAALPELAEAREVFLLDSDDGIRVA